MASQILRVRVGLNNGGQAADPDSCTALFEAPDGTIHTASGAASKNTSVGTGSYYREFTIQDTDDKGMYCAWFFPVYGSDTLIVPVPVKVE